MTRSDRIEIALPDGICIRVGADAGLVALRRVMTAGRRIDAVFDVERSINGLPAEQRLALRQKHVAPLVTDLETWMRGALGKMSRHAEVGRAMDYMLKRWDTFSRFLHDGRICLTAARVIAVELGKAGCQTGGMSQTSRTRKMKTLDSARSAANSSNQICRAWKNTSPF